MPNEFKVKNGLVVDAGGAVITGSTVISGSSLRIDIPSKTNGYVLTSDASGNATWAASGGGGGAAFPYTGDASISGSLTVTGSAIAQSPLHVLSGSTSLLYVSSSGNIGLGTTTPGVNLHTYSTTTSTNTVAENTRLQISSTGTTAAGFGQRIGFYGKASTLDGQLYASIEAPFRFISSTSAWGGRFNFNIVNNGVTITPLQVDGNGPGAVTVTGNLTVNSGVTTTTNIYSTTQGTFMNASTAQTYKTTNAGGAITPLIAVGSRTNDGAGAPAIYIDATNQLVFGAMNTAGTVVPIARAAIQVSGSNNTAGSEAGDLLFLTQTGGTAVSEKMRIFGNSGVLFTSALTAISSSQSHIQITGSIQQAPSSSYQIYGMNITPRMIYTTASQTNTAFRVTPTFSGSAAFSSSQSNIIADFGATSVGTQFSVNDITSGSIYMVNDVSGLPIIEALSDWTVNMYNYPTKVFQKTGSSIIISGSLIQNASTASFAGLVGVGTTTPAYKLDVNGTGRFSGDLTSTGNITAGSTGNVTGNAGIFGQTNNSFVVIGYYGGSQPTYYTTNGSASPISMNFAYNSSFSISGRGTPMIEEYQSGWAVNNSASKRILRATIGVTNLGNTAGSESADLVFGTQSGGTAVAERLRISSTGNVTMTSGSLTVTSGSIIMPQRPAFRVYGSSVTGIPATTTISGSATTVDYNQGSYYNNTTGQFTASLAGLYHVYYNGRTNSGATQQVIIYKNRVAGVGGTAMMMWETTGSNSGHFGVSSILNLAVNDTLEAVVALGTIQFDSNDNWGAAYIG